MKDSANERKCGRYRSLIENFEDQEPTRVVFDPESTTGGSFLDTTSFDTIEVESLFQTFEKPRITLGEISLYRSLINPLMSPAQIACRQEGLKELSENVALREELESLVKGAVNYEKGLFNFMWKRFMGVFSGDSSDKNESPGFGYEAFKKTRHLLRAIQKTSSTIAQPKSPFLVGIVEDLKLVNTNRTSQLILDKAYFTRDGIKTKEERRSWFSGFRFRPSLFNPLLFVLIMAGGVLVFKYFTHVLGDLNSAMGPIIMFMGLPVNVVVAFMLGAYDRDHFIAPMGKELRSDPEMQLVFDALGEIETLLVHDKFSRQFPGPVCLPTIVEADHHQLTAENLWNAPIGTDNKTYVGNDVSLVDERLNFITGPNSGGKTALCKTICQAQILGQSGAYVPATKMSLSVVRHIYYQAPEAGSLETAQGRFATELERTRDIFFNCKEPSLVVLDEPFEGTSFEERLEITRQVLDGFVKTGASVLFITHNFPLVHLYKEQDIGQFLETVFEDNCFTYLFREGIANTSHADRVVTQLGFSRKDIENYLKN